MPTLHERQLLSLLSRALFGGELSVSINSSDYPKIFKEACLHSVAPLALDGVPATDQIPKKLLSVWQDYVFAAFRNNFRVIAAHAVIHRSLTEAGIPYCIIKGVASAAYYKKPDVRMMGDVDFYVPEEAFFRAVAYFKENCYEEQPQGYHHYGYKKDGIDLELHFALPGHLSDRVQARLPRYTASFFADAKTVTDEFGTYVLPSDFHHGLILILHMKQHIVGGGMGLRHLCDYAVFLNKYTDEEFRALFWDALTELELLPLAQLLARLCHRYLGLPLLDWMGDGDLELEDTLMDNILTAGNFGKKDDSFQKSTFLLSQTHGKKHHSFLYLLFASINAHLRKKYRFFHKAPFLLPLAWPFFFCRYAILCLCGKRSFHVVKIAKYTRERAVVYRKLHLDEAERHSNQQNNQEDSIMTSKHEAQLLSLLSRAMFGNALSVEIAAADYAEILKEACLHSVAPLALDGIPDAEAIPEQIRTKWRNYVFRAYRGNCRIFAEHARLHERLTAAGIPYCILKGVASAAFYEKPDLRMMGDVDFLVAHADLEPTASYFAENGYGKPAVCDHHYGYEKDGVKVELHFEVPGRPSGEMGARLSRYTDSLLADAGLVTDSFGSYVLPSDFHHGLILLLHMQEHIATSGIGLRHLCDYAAFVNRYTDAEFRALFEDALSDLGLFFFAQIAARTAHRYLGLPLREWMGDGDPAIEDTLIEDILSAGNFGKKDTSRYQAGFLLSHSRDGKRHGLIYRLFAGINTYLRGKYKLFRKAPILLPLGWPLYFCRYFLLLLRGKRKLKLTRIAKDTREHESLYYSLRLFETKSDKK